MLCLLECFVSVDSKYFLISFLLTLSIYPKIFPFFLTHTNDKKVVVLRLGFFVLLNLIPDFNNTILSENEKQVPRWQ